MTCETLSHDKMFIVGRSNQINGISSLYAWSLLDLLFYLVSFRFSSKLLKNFLNVKNVILGPILFCGRILFTIDF